MKKVFIACILAIIMLMVPITSSVKTENISVKNNEMPKFYITEKDLLIINDFIDNNFEGENLTKAQNIVSDIIMDDLEVNITALADAIVRYGFNPIPEEELDSVTSFDELNQLIQEYWNIVDGEFVRSIFGELIDKIIELIQDRLGWLYDFFDRSVILILDGINLVYDYIQPALLLISILIVKVVNHILSIPDYISDLLKDLFGGEYNEFIDGIVNFTEEFAGDFADLVQQVIDLLTNQPLKSYFEDIKQYVLWLDSKPWEATILVEGVVRKNLGYFEGATITCRGQSYTTNSNGEYSFYIEPNPSDDSFPPNVYYGMHNCQITVSYNGEVLKETPKLLSYCFSGGKITWPFLVIKGKSREIGIQTDLSEKLNLIFERIQIFLSNFFIEKIAHQIKL